MAIRREHLTLHLEQLQQAFGRDQTLPMPPTQPVTTPAAVTTPRRTPTAVPPGTPGSTRSAPTRTANAGRPITAAPAPPPRATPALSGVEAELATLRAEVLTCTKCKLSEGRNNAVFGEGNPKADVLFIGEAPGSNEDRTGRPFVGAAGQLLDRIISNAMGLQRSEVFIANLNKCRPPNNREPQPDEVASCLPFLRQQVALIQPQVIVCLGRVSAQNLLGRKESATRLRGLELDYEGIPVVVTWHPAYLLREPSRKRETWEDIKRCNRLLGRPEVPPAPA